MEVTARLRYLQGSPQKVRLVADLIRGKGVQEAANMLELTNKSAARPLRKLLSSAIANAENRAAAARRRHALRQGDLRRRRSGGEAHPAGAHGPRVPDPAAAEPRHHQARNPYGPPMG